MRFIENLFDKIRYYVQFSRYIPIPIVILTVSAGYNTVHRFVERYSLSAALYCAIFTSMYKLLIVTLKLDIFSSYRPIAMPPTNLR